MSTKFELSRTVITSEALARLHPADIVLGLSRHAAGDWGNCSRADRNENERALVDGARLFSVYQDRRGTKFWVITEADRSATTVLLPGDY